MSRYLYRRAREEQKNYSNAQEAIIDHIDMAITHAHLNFEGEDVTNLIVRLQKCSLDIIAAQEPVKITKGQGLGALRDYVRPDTLPGLSETEPTKDKIVVSVTAPPTTEELLEDIGSILLSDIDLNNRVKNVLKSKNIITVRDLMGVSLLDIYNRTGLGTKSIIEIWNKLKTQYGLDMQIGTVVKETRKTKGKSKMLNVAQ